MFPPKCYWSIGETTEAYLENCMKGAARLKIIIKTFFNWTTPRKSILLKIVNTANQLKDTYMDLKKKHRSSSSNNTADIKFESKDNAVFCSTPCSVAINILNLFVPVFWLTYQIAFLTLQFLSLFPKHTFSTTHTNCILMVCLQMLRKRLEKNIKQIYMEH